MEEKIYQGSRFRVRKVRQQNEFKETHVVRLLAGSWPAFWDLAALCANDFTKDFANGSIGLYGAEIEDITKRLKRVTVLYDDREPY
jgi:hypothetical protein